VTAFIHRIAPGGIDKTQEALDSDDILTGWSEARGLLNSNLDWPAFREILRTAYYSTEKTHRRAGLAAGNMWRFIREMKEGDLVVVPAPSSFYVARVTGPARYLEDNVADDSAYRRPVEWLNEKQRIPRVLARAALLSRLKIQGTSAYAADLKGSVSANINDSHDHLGARSPRLLARSRAFARSFADWWSLLSHAVAPYGRWHPRFYSFEDSPAALP
jgi:hypothetical protein